ncbi:MAG: TetR/AcrR family transcriptional regulator [Deltaproteobacteria bacterium]|nr:TetR/AcrR family transcriptional regulator [Deltaproteobacteria bacterium]
MLPRPQPSQRSGVASEASEGRRSRRRRELHQSILDTAAGLFARDGYETTTVEKIAAAVDIAPATFFNHFRSKEDVLREIGQDVFSRFRRLVDEQLERPVTSLERLHGFATRGAALVRRAPEMTRRVLMAVLRAPRPGEAGAELASMQEDFSQLLRRGRDVPAKDVRDDLDVELAAEILVSVVIGAMSHWINDPAYPLESKLRASFALLADRFLTSTSPARTASRRPAAKRKRKTP